MKKGIIFALFTSFAVVIASCNKDDDENDKSNKSNYNGNVVDLGLPSRIQWATSNLGAANSWDYGNYYAWGETETKDDYSWETYKYCKGNCKLITKYCHDAYWGNGGFTDALTYLETADDAVTVALGSGYSTPTVADWEELSRQCYWVWTENYNNRNVSGYIVYKAKSSGNRGTKVYSGDTPSASYSLSDTHIFLPATGYRFHTDLEGVGLDGRYWSTSLSDDYPDEAYYNDFISIDVDPLHYGARCYGLPVRPVRRR